VAHTVCTIPLAYGGSLHIVIRYSIAIVHLLHGDKAVLDEKLPRPVDMRIGAFFLRFVLELPNLKQRDDLCQVE